MSAIRNRQKFRLFDYVKEHGPTLFIAFAGFICIGIAKWPNSTLLYGDILKGFGEALVIAGVIGIVVEPILKRRLMREAAEGVFEHILGFDLEPQIRERLKEIAFSQTYYYREVHLHFTVNRSTESTVRLTCRSIMEVRSASSKPFEYSVRFISDRADRTNVHEMSLSPNSLHSGFVINPLKQADPEDADIDIWMSPKITLQPHSIEAPIYRTSTLFSCEMSLDGYYNYTPSKPMIGVSVRIESDPDVEVSVARPAQQRGQQWFFSNVVMNGEKVTVRWRPKSNPSGS